MARQYRQGTCGTCGSTGAQLAEDDASHRAISSETRGTSAASTRNYAGADDASVACYSSESDASNEDSSPRCSITGEYS